MARAKVNSEKVGKTRASKVQKKVVNENSPQPKRGRPAKESGEVKKKEIKPSKGVSTPSKKATTYPPASKMVTQAFSVLKNRKGTTLAAIRNHIAAQYDCKVSKKIQRNMKKFIEAEFSAGRIKMVNYDGNKIKFNQRFAFVE